MDRKWNKEARTGGPLFLSTPGLFLISAEALFTCLIFGVQYTLFDRTCSYLRELYSLDIRSLPIRSVGAAFGWLWSDRYERQVIEQVHQLIQPLIDWMEEAELDDIPARCLGIWSLYYVGYRHAVVQGGTADDCLAAIKPSLRYYLEFPRPMELAKGSNNQRNKNKARSKGPMDVPLKVH